MALSELVYLLIRLVERWWNDDISKAHGPPLPWRPTCTWQLIVSSSTSTTLMTSVVFFAFLALFANWSIAFKLYCQPSVVCCLAANSRSHGNASAMQLNCYSAGRRNEIDWIVCWILIVFLFCGGGFFAVKFATSWLAGFTLWLAPWVPIPSAPSTRTPTRSTCPSSVPGFQKR